MAEKASRSNVSSPPFVHGKRTDLARLAAKALRPDGVLAVMCGQSYLPEILAAMTKTLNLPLDIGVSDAGTRPAHVGTKNLYAMEASHCVWEDPTRLGTRCD